MDHRGRFACRVDQAGHHGRQDGSQDRARLGERGQQAPYYGTLGQGVQQFL